MRQEYSENSKSEQVYKIKILLFVFFWKSIVIWINLLKGGSQSLGFVK